MSIITSPVEIGGDATSTPKKIRILIVPSDQYGVG